MPLKNGHFTARERAFARFMGRTGDSEYAATKAGYSSPASVGRTLMTKPAIKAAALAEAEKMLRDEILPLALQVHKRLLTDAAVPAGAQLGATKLAYDRTLGVDDGKAEKEPSEMSYDELQASIDQLRQAQDQLAGQAIDVTPLSPDSGVFD